MISTDYLKQVINPIDLAYRTLGNPITRKNEVLWYKSPFRVEERTASFEVSDIGFHDFGTHRHYDIIDFTKRLYSCSFKDAVEILKNMYNLEDNEYYNDRVKNYIEQQKLARKKYAERVEKWFKDFMSFIFQANEENEYLIKLMKNKFDTLAVLYDRQIYLGCLCEEIINISSFKEKETLRNKITKEGLPSWMEYQKNYGLILAN